MDFFCACVEKKSGRFKRRMRKIPKLHNYSCLRSFFGELFSWSKYKVLYTFFRIFRSIYFSSRFFGGFESSSGHGFCHLFSSHISTGILNNFFVISGINKTFLLILSPVPTKIVYYNAVADLSKKSQEVWRENLLFKKDFSMAIVSQKKWSPSSKTVFSFRNGMKKNQNDFVKKLPRLVQKKSTVSFYLKRCVGKKLQRDFFQCKSRRVNEEQEQT